MLQRAAFSFEKQAIWVRDFRFSKRERFCRGQPDDPAGHSAGNAAVPAGLQAQRTAGRTVTADDTALQALRRRRAGTLAAEFLHQMQALGLTEAEIETLLRETAQQAPKKE